jgi:outer membrane protein OmpU
MSVGIETESYNPRERIMKKVLLTTTALVMTAGVAAANPTMSGTFGVAVSSQDGADYTVHTGVDLNFGFSATTDVGLTASTSIDMGAGETVDYNDDFAIDTQDMGRDATPVITLGYEGFTLAVAKDDIDNLFDDSQHEDFSFAGSAGGISFAMTADMDDDATSYKLGYTTGDLTVTVTGTNDDDAAGTGGSASKIAASYAMGDLTLSASMEDESKADDTEDDNTFGVAYTMDAITVKYTMIDPGGAAKDMGDEWDASISYSAGAFSASYAVDEADVTELVAEYDLGGATLFASNKEGTATDDQTAMGINFKF